MELLVSASKDPSGRIVAMKVLEETGFSTSRTHFAAPASDSHEESRWSSAIEEFEGYDFLQVHS